MGRGTGAGAIVGTIVGSFFGAPVTGAFIGASLGSSIDQYGQAKDISRANFGNDTNSPRYGFGALRTSTSNEIPVAVIYGVLKIAGNWIFSTRPSSTQDRLQGLGEGEIGAINDVRLNDKPAQDLEGVTFTKHVGTTAQTVDTRATGEAFGLRSLAYVGWTLKSSPALPGGEPTATSVVDGLKVEKWNGSDWTTLPKATDRNAAACVRDYIISSKHGVGLVSTDLDEASFGEVYDHSEALIDSPSLGTLNQFYDDGRCKNAIAVKKVAVGDKVTGRTADSVVGLQINDTEITETLDFWRDGVILFETGSAAGASRRITRSNVGLVLYENETATVQAGDKYTLIKSLGFGVFEAAQSFKPSITAGVVRVQLSMQQIDAAGGTLTVEIQGDSGGLPDDTAIATSATVTPASIVENAFEWVDFTFSTPAAVTSGTLFWIVVKHTFTSGGIEWKRDKVHAEYPDGYAANKEITDNGTITGWQAAPQQDNSFRVFLDKEKRFQLDIALDAKKPHLDHLSDMLMTFGGFLVISGSTIKLRVEKNDSAVATIDEDQIVEGSMSFTYPTKGERLNRCLVQFINPLEFHAKVVAQAEDRPDQDTRGIVDRTIQLLGITRPSQASRMAHFYLNMTKFARIIITFRVGIEHMNWEPGDIVNVTHSLGFFSVKPFRTISIEEAENDEFIVVAREHEPTLNSDKPFADEPTGRFFSKEDPFGVPEDVENCTVDIVDGDTLEINWDAVPDIDLAHYEIRRGSFWETGQIVATKISATTFRTTNFPLGTRTYHVKAIDDDGNESQNSCRDSIAIAGLPTRNVVFTHREWSAGLQGTLTGDAQISYNNNFRLEAYRRAVVLKTDDTWATKAGTWQDAFDNGDRWDFPKPASASGAYETPTIDIGQVAKVNIRLDMATLVEKPGADVRVEVSTSTDNITFTAFQPFTAGERTMRYAKLKIILSTTDINKEAQLLNFDVVFDVPDRIVTFLNQTVLVGGTVFDFVPDFVTLSSVVATTFGSSALVPIITAQSVASATVKVFDKDGVDVGGSINLTANGFGEVS